MPQPSDWRIQLQRIFHISGWLLLFCGRFVVFSILGLDETHRHAASITRHQALMVGLASLGILVSAVLCWVTAHGLKRSRAWSRWTGVCACAILLPGFPWLTLAGAAGLYVLLTKLPRLEAPPAPKQTTDYWTRKRKSWVQQVFIYIGFFGALGPGMAWFQQYARRLWMPAWKTHGEGLLYLIAFGLWITAIHEMGHAIVAWAFCHRVRRINIGPFTFSNTSFGYQFHFQWNRLLSGGGHVAAIPTDGEHLRLKLIAMILAGPGASLLNGFLMFVVFLSLPGTNWQSYWWIPGFICVLSVFDCVLNLVPAGYSDGSMLFHLILWTRHGQGLIQHLQAAQMHEDADACHKQADYEKEVELREAALRRAQEGGEESALAIAASHHSLGHARKSLGDWPGAEAEFRKCLGFEAECALNPPMAAGAWLGLQRVCITRHHVDEAARAYASAVPLLEGRKKDRHKTGLAATRAVLALVHRRGGTFDKALPEIAEALRTLPGGRDRLLLRASMYSIQAQCELAMDSVERGLAAAHHVTDILHSGKLKPEQRNQGWNELGELGEELWRLGQDALAVDLLRETIEKLELGRAAATAAQYRIKLSAAYRQLGKLDDGWRWLPNESGLSTVSRRCLLAERARLQLAAGHANEAVADCRELLALWQTAPNDPVAEIAVAEALLAEAYLESGDYEQAEALARKAVDVLGPWKHFEVAGCLITRALAQRRITGEWTPVSMDEIRMLIQDDPLLSPAAKTRILETQAARVERHGPTKEVVSQGMRNARPVALSHNAYS